MTRDLCDLRRRAQGLAWALALVIVVSGGAEAPASECGDALAGQSVTWIVPNAPGGGYDTFSRLIAPLYGRALGAEMRIENRAGAGGTVGAIAIKEAAPDGTTVGILNGPGLFMAVLSGDTQTPNPATDFTILARVARSQHVWVTGAASGIKSIDDLFALAGTRPVLFAVRDVGGVAFVDIATTSHLLQLDHKIIAGFEGSRDATLAAIRGDVDLIAYSFDSIGDRLDPNDLRPLLQISDHPIASDPAITDVPVLGGTDGIAARRAAQLRQDVDEAVADATAIVSLVGAGRLIVAPTGLEPDLQRCMQESLLNVLKSADFRAAVEKANLSLDIAGPSEVEADFRALASRSERFLPVIEAATERLRQ